MSDQRSIFFDEWQACLRTHYQFVIQDGDTITESTLRAVLLQSGVSEDELRALAEAALRQAPPETGAAPVPETADPPARKSGQMSLF